MLMSQKAYVVNCKMSVYAQQCCILACPRDGREKHGEWTEKMSVCVCT